MGQPMAKDMKTRTDREPRAEKYSNSARQLSITNALSMLLESFTKPCWSANTTWQQECHIVTRCHIESMTAYQPLLPEALRVNRLCVVKQGLETIPMINHPEPYWDSPCIQCQWQDCSSEDDRNNIYSPETGRDFRHGDTV